MRPHSRPAIDLDHDGGDATDMSSGRVACTAERAGTIRLLLSDAVAGSPGAEPGSFAVPRKAGSDRLPAFTPAATRKNRA
jgi:hypothetical protein